MNLVLHPNAIMTWNKAKVYYEMYGQLIHAGDYQVEPDVCNKSMMSCS